MQVKKSGCSCGPLDSEFIWCFQRYLMQNARNKVIPSENLQLFTQKAIELFDLERTVKGHLVQLPCSGQGHL